MVERTLIIFKPDAVKRRLIGRILSRFEDRGLMLTELKLFNLSGKDAREFYSIHVNKHFFDELIAFITFRRERCSQCG